jgi:hypothetical protein
VIGFRVVAGATVCALAIGLAAAVAGRPLQPAEPSSPVFAPQLAVDGSEAFDAPAIADSIALILAEQNAAAFAVEASVVEADSDEDIVLASSVHRLDNDEPAPEPELDPEAAESIEAEEDEIDAVSEAVSASGIEVNSVEIEVTGVASTVVDDSTARVTVLIETVRSMEGLPDWEEAVYYVAVIDTANSAITDIEVHDEFWYQKHPTDLETDLSEVAPAEPELSIEPAALTPSGKAAAVAYANKYWRSYNPAYLASPNDCTNFISQALYAGGWTKKGTDSTGENRKRNTVWWYTGTGAYPKSYSWADAQVWREFAQGQGRVASIITNNTRAGDVIQYDIGLNGMNHTTIVTFYDTDTRQPLLTYHTSNTHNKPFSAFLAAVKTEAGSQDYRLWGWRT